MSDALALREDYPAALKPLRIVQFLKWMRRRDGGVVNTVSLLCPMLATLGHRVTLISCEDDDLTDPIWVRQSPRPGEAIRHEDGKVASVRVPIRDRLAELRGKTALQSERDDPLQLITPEGLRVCEAVLRDADVLHLHGVWASSNIQLANLARRLRVPFVVSPHGMLDDWSLSKGSFKKKLHLALFSRRVLDDALRVHFEVEEEARQGRVHVKAPVVVGPPPPIDPRSFEPLPSKDLALGAFPQLKTDAFKVLFLGRLSPKKAPDALIRAAKIWKDRGLPIQTFIAGKGHPPEFEGELKVLAQALGVQDSVHFLGLVTGDLKWSLFQAVDVTALPTSQENFGIALVESMICGTPIVTTRQVDTWREFEQAGAVILPGGLGVAQQTADAIAQLATDRSRAHAFGKQSQAWATRTYSPDMLAQWYAKILDPGTTS